MLACMLVGEPVFGVDSGVPLRVDLQTRPDGWFFDDVVVTTSVGARRHRFAFSVKSNPQFIAKSAPSDFVAAVWEQWHHIGSTLFDRSLDFIGLVTATLSPAAAQSLSGIAEKARVHDPELFPARLATPKWASEDERMLFASFACPASLGQATTDAETTRLLQRLRFIQCDFGDVSSKSQNHALELCRRAVRSHSLADAQMLWSILREVASELRPLAGSLTLTGLIDRLRVRVQLADYPEHAGDWEKLDARSMREVSLVRNSIADRIRVSREAQVEAVVGSLRDHVQVALVGPSGVGKSALARAVFERRRVNGDRTLWVDASSLDRVADFGAFEAALQLLHPLAEVLGKETSQDPVLILDGLDRLYSEHAFRSVATLLRMVAGERTTRWRVLAVCQSQEWQRTLDALQRASTPSVEWLNHDAAPVEPSSLQVVGEAAPRLVRLLSLHPTVFRNLKLLDLVVRRLDGGAQIDATAWVGESSVAEWFWSAEVERGAGALSRGRFARHLAQAQADQLAVSVPLDSLDASSMSAAESLVADQLLVRTSDDRIAFAHDLYGDWARLRILLTHRTNLVGYLREQHRHDSPLWHRAIRLLGIHLLERQDGADEWKTLMSSFASAEMFIVRDLLLEAPAFAMNARALLDRVFPHLVDGDGELLRRLLRRFLAFATDPHEQRLDVARTFGLDVNEARAVFRFPNGPNWLDMLTVLHAHCDEALSAAACEVARVVEMWLELSPPGAIRRSEAADLAVLLGQRAVDSHDGWRASDPREDRRRFYKCMLLASPERADEVALLARVATERLPKPVVAPAPFVTVFDPGVIRGPWPDGPLARVDQDFQKVVLEGADFRKLYRERPLIAREVILATLIDAPREEHWGSSRRDLGLAYCEWQPSLFTRGPFSLCLRDNFEAGLELIMRLVEFTTEQSSDQATRRMNDRRALASAEGRELDREDDATCPNFLLLHDGTTELRFTGDAGSYGWSAGLTLPGGYSPLPPPPVASALMALEQHFYRRLVAGEDVADELTMTFARTRCVAALGVLVDVGRREPTLFSGPLRALLSAPELYSWEIAKRVQGRTHLMIGASMEGRIFMELAQQFHGLEHRKRDLREVATVLMLTSTEMQSFFSSVRAWWERRRVTGELLSAMAEQLNLQLDLANFEIREDPIHGPVVANVAIERVQAAKFDEHRTMNNRMLLMGFPMRCRTILDERQIQTDAQLDEFWQTWMRIRELADAGAALPEGGLGDEYINGITGGIAVLLWSDEWLSRQTQRREEVQGALELLLGGDPPARHGLSDEGDISTWTWDCFLAESIAMLWAREPNDARWRLPVANMVFAMKYVVVRHFFSRCAEHRTAHPDDFGRLRRLALDWAHGRARVEILRGRQHRPVELDEPMLGRLWSDLMAWRDEQVAAFVDGSLATAPANWSRFDELSRFAEIDALPRGRDARLMDFHLVRCSHEWMPLPDDALNDAERSEVIQFWRVALDVVAARPRADLKRRDHQYPDEDEVWVLEKVAAVVLQLRPDEEPELFWATTVELHSEGHHWPHKFFNELHGRALHAEQTPDTYERLLRQIAAQALSEVDGKPRWSGREAVWDALIGIDGWVLKLWAPRHSRHVVAVWDVVCEWMRTAPRDGRRLGRFAGWLSKPAAADIRLGTLAWFLECVRADKVRSAYRDEDPDDALAKLLNVVWEQDQNQLRANADSFAAFRGLLAWLVERQNALGMDLQGRIGGLTGAR